jgi:DNA repair protein SbcC/Rad50
MRPLELTVTGLRSYRTTITVAFPDDWRLAAVVGPTGAGKSSLLEAIVYALFGSGTVPGASQPTNLITDDSREMRVTFRFALGPEQFEIVRTYRRVGHVQPVFRSSTRTYTGVQDVDEAVTRLLGLRQEAFCSTVLLPQGKFATLLQAGGSVQKETLDAFFRLAEVNELSERLVTAAAAVASRRKQVQTVREQLPADPVAEAQEAERRLGDAKRRRDAADKLAEVVAAQERTVVAEAGRAETARQRQVILLRIASDLEAVAQKATGLEPIADEIASDEQTLLERITGASTAVGEARKTLASLDGPTVEATAARVGALQDRIREANDARGHARSTATDAVQARARLGLIRAERDRLFEGRDQIRNAYEESRDAKNEASDRFDRLRNLFDKAERTAAAVERAEARRGAAAKELDFAQEAEDRARQEFDEAGRRVTPAEVAAAAAGEALADAQTKEVAANQRVEGLRRLRREADDRRSERDRLHEALTISRIALEEERGHATQATRRESEHKVLWQQAQTASRQARRDDAAAAAAVGCGPGDVCPVCSRELPDTFVPPSPSTKVTAAEAAEQKLHDELASRHRASATAEANVAARMRDETSITAQLRDAELALARAEGGVSEYGVDLEGVVAAAHEARVRLEGARRTDQAASKALSQARADVGALERTISPLAATTVRAISALGTATKDRDDAAQTHQQVLAAFAEAGGNDALSRAKVELAEASEILSNFEGPLDDAERAANDAEARLSSSEQSAAALRAAADSAASHSRRTMEAVASALTNIHETARRGATNDPVAVVQAAERWVAERRALIAEADRGRVEAESALDRAESAIVALRARRVAEVERPLAEASSAGTRLAATAGVSSPASGLGPIKLAAWAKAAMTQARDLAADHERDAEAADAEANRARAAVREACDAAGIERSRLDGWRAEKQSEVGSATEAWRQATQTAKRARDLDGALHASADRYRLLALARDLCQGRESFANHVLVARRQGLIAEAAAILSELSSGHLTFADDVGSAFSVLDTGTGSIRDPRLLSGGEQFQASLALALGLVEIAARAGSRIECLFLDEGFGALDPASLDIALDALEAAARRGRRIVAVTHVDGVTARADQVLGVSGSEAGSQAAWRGTELGVTG